jgi:hypothetical protein
MGEYAPRYGCVAPLTGAPAGATFETWSEHLSPAVETMDPDLAITIGFVAEVLLLALVFTVYVVHEVHEAHAESATVEERRNRQGIR